MDISKAPFYLKLEGVAASMTPADAIRYLVAISVKLELHVQADINERPVHARPDTDPENLVQAYNKAVDKNWEKHIPVFEFMG